MWVVDKTRVPGGALGLPQVGEKPLPPAGRVGWDTALPGQSTKNNRSRSNTCPWVLPILLTQTESFTRWYDNHINLFPSSKRETNWRTVIVFSILGSTAHGCQFPKQVCNNTNITSAAETMSSAGRTSSNEKSLIALNGRHMDCSSP